MYLNVMMLLLTFSAANCSLLSTHRNRNCESTRFPRACTEFMVTELNQSSENTVSLHTLALRAAVHQAMGIRSTVKKFSMQYNDNGNGHTKEKNAWDDCVELHESSIHLLNRALNSKRPRSRSTLMTWLSAAQTNIDTCRTGFRDFGLSDHAVGKILRPVWELLTNAMSLKEDGAKEAFRPTSRTFPNWLTINDQKLLRSSSPATRSDLVVTKDGLGNCTTITEAIDKAKKLKYKGRFIIYVKQGIYDENVKIGRKVKNIMLVGDGIGRTVITGNWNLVDGYTTYKSATFGVSGSGFIAINITFRNTAGPQKHQAVAFRSDSDKSALYRCSFEGFQDSLYVHSQRQFYKECSISGTVDFIFGNAAAVLQNCVIYARRPMDEQNIVITAQSRTDVSQTTGISIHRCSIMASPELKPVLRSFRTYLGRPWRQYSRTVYIRSYFDKLVNGEGWLAWNRTFALDTLYYGEFQNMGPGANLTGRVKWPGYQPNMTTTDAGRYTAGEFIGGRDWLADTGVPFNLNL